MISTDIDYPEGLPNPLREGHDSNAVQPFGRTPMASGRARQRRKFTSVPTVDSFGWLFTDPQAAAFEAWFRDDVHDGADWFNIRRKTPLGMQSLVCRFTGMYRGPSLVGRSLWRYTAELEVWERPIMPEPWGQFPDFIIHMSIFDQAMNREWPEA